MLSFSSARLISLNVPTKTLLFQGGSNWRRFLHRSSVCAFPSMSTGLEGAYARGGMGDRLTQSILAKSFRGELVPQDPNDEPASALLERIRL